MSRFLFLTLALLAIALPFGTTAQDRRLSVLDREGNSLAEWFVNPRTTIEFSEDREAMLFNSPGSEAQPPVWLRDADHMQFFIDHSSVPSLGIDRGKSSWGLKANPVSGSFLEIHSENGTSATLRHSIRISDTSGKLLCGRPDWRGEPIDISRLQPGHYLLTIDNQTITFIRK